MKDSDKLLPCGLTRAELWERIAREIRRNVAKPQGDYEGAILDRQSANDTR